MVPAAGSFHCPSQNHWGWKSLPRLSPPISPTPSHSPKVPKCHIQAFLEHLQGWGPHHPAKHPLPMPQHHFHGEVLPISNLNLPCSGLRQISQGVQPSQHLPNSNSCRRPQEYNTFHLLVSWICLFLFVCFESHPRKLVYVVLVSPNPTWTICLPAQGIKSNNSFLCWLINLHAAFKVGFLFCFPIGRQGCSIYKGQVNCVQSVEP